MNDGLLGGFGGLNNVAASTLAVTEYKSGSGLHTFNAGTRYFRATLVGGGGGGAGGGTAGRKGGGGGGETFIATLPVSTPTMAFAVGAAGAGGTTGDGGHGGNTLLGGLTAFGGMAGSLCTSAATGGGVGGGGTKSATSLPRTGSMPGGCGGCYFNVSAVATDGRAAGLPQQADPTAANEPFGGGLKIVDGSGGGSSLMGSGGSGAATSTAAGSVGAGYGAGGGSGGVTSGNGAAGTGGYIRMEEFA